MLKYLPRFGNGYLRQGYGWRQKKTEFLSLQPSFTRNKELKQCKFPIFDKLKEENIREWIKI